MEGLKILISPKLAKRLNKSVYASLGRHIGYALTRGNCQDCKDRDGNYPVTILLGEPEKGKGCD